MIKNTSESQKFCNISVCASLYQGTKAIHPWQVPDVIVSILVVDMLIYFALLYSECNLKATQMNRQHSLIQEHMFYTFELGYNAMEATRNICCVKHEDTVDHSTVTNLAQVAGSLTIRQVHFGLKPQILRLCSKPWRQIWCVVLEEYQTLSPYVTITTLAKASKAAKLCLIILQNF